MREGDLGSKGPLEKEMDPFQYSCLGNSVDRGAWQATIHGVAESDTTKRLSTAQLGLLGGKIILQSPMLLPRFNFLSCPNACLP